MNAEEVLDNWTDIESDDSDGSEEERENDTEESGEEFGEDGQTWREVPGLQINNLYANCYKNSGYAIEQHLYIAKLHNRCTASAAYHLHILCGSWGQYWTPP